MANRISAQGTEAELDRDGVWQSADAVLRADLNRICGIDVISGSDPQPAWKQLDCAVDRFQAVILERDPPAPTVPGRVY